MKVIFKQRFPQPPIDSYFSVENTFLPRFSAHECLLISLTIRYD